MVDIPDLKSVDREVVGVRLPPLVPNKDTVINMNKKKLIKEFQEEFVLSKKYEYDLDKDACGKTIEILVPRHHAKRVKQKLPRRWQGYRVIVMFREERKVNTEEL